ncbi:MAG: alpha/beta hydrolase [Proteobacteria bacterium]|nr:alpha/beta hydrolase [Pseudomonadota bacterium]
MRCEHRNPLRFEAARCLLLAAAALASAPVMAIADNAAQPAAPQTPPNSMGPAQRAGAMLDSALDSTRAWLGRQSDWVSDQAQSGQRQARKWWNTTKVTTWGVEEPARAAEVWLAQPVPCGPPNPASPCADMSVFWQRLSAGSRSPLPSHLVLLVHGLDEPGGMWNDLAPALFEHSFAVAKFDYPNDQHIADSADMLAAAIRGLASRGVKQVDIVAHSMGGLVSRDVLTRSAYYAGDGSAHDGFPAVSRFIVIGAPSAGSILAPLQPVSEMREHISRHLEGLSARDDGWLHSYADGNGEAAEDLAPDSAFLRDLRSRPNPHNVAITNIVSSLVTPAHQDDLLSLADQASGWLEKAGFEHRPPMRQFVQEAISDVGDGLVSCSSAEWPGVTDTVRLCADHRGVVQRWRWLDTVDPDCRYHDRIPQGIPVILDRLSRDH